MIYRTFTDWLAFAFPWLTDLSSPDAARLRAAWEAGEAGQPWHSDSPSWSRDAKNEQSAWKAAQEASK